MPVSGNSIAGKSYQSFTISEPLLQKVTEAVIKGEGEAKSSGEVKSLEVFYLGFRQNISIGRIFIVPASICNKPKDFPIALLYGTVVKLLNLGSEAADLIAMQTGSEFDEEEDVKSHLTSLKEKAFTTEDGKEVSLIVFAPNWVGIREYVAFQFTDDEDKLRNLLRHLIFCVYYNPAVSSAFDALMTTVDTWKLDVTDISPKLTYPAITESPFRAYPELLKAASTKKRIFLTAKTADAITQEQLEPAEMDAFQALEDALGGALTKTKAPEEVADKDYKKPAVGAEVPKSDDGTGAEKSASQKEGRYLRIDEARAAGKKALAEGLKVGPYTVKSMPSTPMNNEEMQGQMDYVGTMLDGVETVPEDELEWTPEYRSRMFKGKGSKQADFPGHADPTPQQGESVVVKQDGQIKAGPFSLNEALDWIMDEEANGIGLSRGGYEIEEAGATETAPMMHGPEMAIASKVGYARKRARTGDSFLDSYIETALWSSNDESTPQGGEPMDKNYGPQDLAPETIEAMKKDCEGFQNQNQELINRAVTEDGASFPQVAHDFWLTRNGHGAGFWDGDYPITGDELTRASKVFGEANLYIGDDGMIYQYEASHTDPNEAGYPGEIAGHIGSKKKADTADNPSNEAGGKNPIHPKTDAEKANTRGKTPELAPEAKSAALKKVAYVSHCPGHKNSKGESAEWCVKSHEDDHIISSHGSEEAAKRHLQDMHAHSGAKKAYGVHPEGCECGFCKKKGDIGGKKEEKDEKKTAAEKPLSPIEKKLMEKGFRYTKENHPFLTDLKIPTYIRGDGPSADVIFIFQGKPLTSDQMYEEVKNNWRPARSDERNWLASGGLERYFIKSQPKAAGRSSTPKFVLRMHVPGFHLTDSAWNVGGHGQVPGMGRPSPESLARYVDSFIKSTQPGGPNEHLGPMVPTDAAIYLNDGTYTNPVAVWKNPKTAATPIKKRVTADTADNPANEKGGEGAMDPKTDKDKPVTASNRDPLVVKFGKVKDSLGNIKEGWLILDGSQVRGVHATEEKAVGAAEGIASISIVGGVKRPVKVVKNASTHKTAAADLIAEELMRAPDEEEDTIVASTKFKQASDKREAGLRHNRRQHKLDGEDGDDFYGAIDAAWNGLKDSMRERWASLEVTKVADQSVEPDISEAKAAIEGESKAELSKEKSEGGPEVATKTTEICELADQKTSPDHGGVPRLAGDINISVSTDAGKSKVKSKLPLGDGKKDDKKDKKDDKKKKADLGSAGNLMDQRDRLYSAISTADPARQITLKREIERLNRAIETETVNDRTTNSAPSESWGKLTSAGKKADQSVSPDLSKAKSELTHGAKESIGVSNDPTYKETKQPIELAKQADQSVAPDIEKARAAVKGQSKVELADNPDATKTTDARELEKQAGKDEKKDCKFCHGKGKNPFNDKRECSQCKGTGKQACHPLGDDLDETVEVGYIGDLADLGANLPEVANSKEEPHESYQAGEGGLNNEPKR